MSNSFYLTLTTNDHYGPYAYTSSYFTTYFECPLEFDESFEVALVGMVYDDKIKNNLGKIKFFKNNNYLFTYDIFVYSFESIEQYLQRINLDIKLELEKFDIKYKIIPKFEIKNHRLEFNHVDFNIELSGKIEELLKCDKYISISSILSYMDFNINDIFIETDIIEQQKYGLTYRSLLAIITRDTNNSTRKQARIINPHYLKLNKSRINTITISICDVNGNLLNLVGENNIIVQLHFRKIKNGL